MRIYDGLEDQALKRTRRVLAVGAFDGMHRGHQRLLGHVCRTAREYGVESAIMTFEPIPAQVFRPQGADNVRLTVRPERDRELVRQCVETAVVVPFDEDFRNIRAVEFARDVLVERLGVIALVASKTHAFGRNAEADVRRITELGMESGFEVHVLPPILVDGRRINSTDIRRRLWEGDVEGAGEWLGRPYDLAGEVVRGRGLGRKLGFPTANLRPSAEKLVPGDGVYACAARVEAPGAAPGPWTAAAVSIGNTPTVGDEGRVIEAFLLDSPEELDLAGKSVRLAFARRLRDQQAYPSMEDLAAQVQRDIQAVREVVAAARSTNPIGDTPHVH